MTWWLTVPWRFGSHYRHSANESAQQNQEQGAVEDQENEAKVKRLNDLVGSPIGMTGHPVGRLYWITSVSANEMNNRPYAEKVEARAMIEEALRLRLLFTGKIRWPSSGSQPYEENWSWMFTTTGTYSRALTGFTTLGTTVYNAYKSGLSHAWAGWTAGGSIASRRPAWRPLPEPGQFIQDANSLVLNLVVSKWQGFGLPLDIPGGYWVP